MRAGVWLCFLLGCTGLTSAAVYTQLGGDAFLRFSESKKVDFFQLEREALGKCQAFPNPVSLATNLDVDDSLIYVGGNFLMTVDYSTSEYSLFSCQMNQNIAQSSKTLECETTYSGKSMRFSSDQPQRQLAYIEMSRLVQYDAESGDFSILGISKEASCKDSDSCGVRPVAVMTGNLGDYCTAEGNPTSAGFQVTGAGVDEFFVSCKNSDSFSIVRLYPGEAGALAAVVVKAGAIAHSSRMLSLGGAVVMGLADSGVYTIFDCSGESCELLSSDSLENARCTATSKTECLEDSRCGFCSETGVCQEGDALGPCGGHCSLWHTADNTVQAKPSVYDDSIPRVQYVFLGNSAVMHYDAQEGSYEIHTLTPNSPSLRGRCPPLSQAPLYSGRLPFKSNTVSSFKDNSVLFVNPETGRYAVWTCQRFGREGAFGAAAPCSTSATGTWSAGIGQRDFVTIGNLTLNMDHASGSLSVFHNEHRDPAQSDSDGSEDQALAGVFSPKPLVNSYRPDFKGHALTGIGHNYVLEHNKQTGEYRVWVFDGKRLTLDGPGARGELPTYEPSRLLYMGTDRLMSITDENEYLMLRFDTAMLTKPGDLPLSAIGRASKQTVSCDYKTCGECTADSACGWCGSQNTCMPGNGVAACNLGNGQACQSWMFDYCAASSCQSRLLEADCRADDSCAWCGSSGLCTRQVNGTAVNCDSV